MKPQKVKPKDWFWDNNYPVRILFESKEENYSAIWGKYKNQKALGVRWNGGVNRGYPGQGGHPTWYVEPNFIAIAILQRLQTMAIDTGKTKYLDDINFAIEELTDLMSDE